jgi:hypothetical protein
VILSPRNIYIFVPHIAIENAGEYVGQSDVPLEDEGNGKRFRKRLNILDRLALAGLGCSLASPG